jgi:uncharacterized protein
MLFLLSPAKSLDYDTPVSPELLHTKPVFTPQAAELIEILRSYTPAQISTLMHLSDNLSALNVARYQAWRPRATPANAKQAVLAFNGDVYEGLNAATLPTTSLLWAQDHLISLSGLYGVLRPLDLLQPYRLEMGTALANAQGKNLYQFWGSRIAAHLNACQKGEPDPVVVNLASQEYFKAVDTRHLKARVVDCVFQEYKNGNYKIISFMAKRARGLMARFAIEQRVQSVAQLTAFDAEGYVYCEAASTASSLIFRRSAV